MWKRNKDVKERSRFGEGVAGYNSKQGSHDLMKTMVPEQVSWGFWVSHDPCIGNSDAKALR